MAPVQTKKRRSKELYTDKNSFDDLYNIDKSAEILQAK